MDHIKSTKNIHFRQIRWLILDEADRILDLGFEKDLTVILNAVNAECQERQNVLLSATLTEGVARLADISLHDPVSISVLDESHDVSSPESEAFLEASPPQATDELDGFAIPAGLEQHVVVVPSKLRLVCLAAFILQKCKFERDQKVIVFFSSCELVEFHYTLFLQTLLSGSGALAPEHLPSTSTPLKFLRLHSALEQEERTAVFQDFTHSKTGILFARILQLGAWISLKSHGLSSTTLRLHLPNTSTGLGERPGLAAMGAACSSWLLRRQNMSTRWLLTKSTFLR